MATTKPDLTRVWASGAPPGNVVDPDITAPGKFNAGWLAEIPPFEHFNFLQKTFSQGLAHINEQGVAEWDADTLYPEFAWAKGSDGIVYVSNSEQNGNDPVTSTNGTWSYKISGSPVIQVSNLSALSSLKTSSLKEGQVAEVINTLRSGSFIWREGNKSASVSADPRQGIWVAPTGAPTGASGAFERRVNQQVSAGWWGALFDGSNDTQAWSDAVLHSRNLGLPIVDSGSTTVSGLIFTGNVYIKSNSKLTFNITAGSADHFILNCTSGTLYLDQIWFDSSAGTAGNFGILCSDTASLKAQRCYFLNAVLNGGYGEGLKFISTGTCELQGCYANGNDANGFAIDQASRVVITESHADSNGVAGFDLNNWDPALSQNINNVTIANCTARNNLNGFIFGNAYNDNDFTGDNFGYNNNVITNVILTNCLANSNSKYGFIFAMTRGVCSDIIAFNNAFGGVLVNGNYIRIENPTIMNNPLYGIDLGSSSNVSINGGAVMFNATSGGTGFLLEACQFVEVNGTLVKGNGATGDANMVINAVGGTGDGRFFPLKASTISLNAIVDCNPNQIGLIIKDNPDAVIDMNTYRGQNPLLYTRYAIRTNNLCIRAKPFTKNYVATTGVGGKVVFPDTVTEVLLSETTTVTSIRPNSYDYFLSAIPYVTITAGGSGYNPATTTIVITGNGTGATAIAMVNNGVLVGVRMETFGSGYTTATVAVVGSGSGAAVTAKIGLDLIVGQEVSLAHNQAQLLNRVGPPVLVFPSATATLSAPAAGRITFSERYGSWQVVSNNFGI